MFGLKKETEIPGSNHTGAINSLVTGTTITGNITSKSDIRIDGRLEGNLYSDAKVVVGKNALIVGDIFCVSILIAGKIEGNIVAKDKLHIQESGIVEGDLSTNKLIVEDGAVFTGASVMGKTPNKAKEHETNASRKGKKDKTVQKAS